MAITPINAPNKPAKKDPMDRILQGLQIANEVFKIPVGYQNLKEQQASTALKENELGTKERLGRLEYTPAELSQAKLVPAGPDDKNGFDAFLLMPNNQKQSLRVKPQADIGQMENLLDIQLKSNELAQAPMKNKAAAVALANAEREAGTPKPDQSLAAGFATMMERGNKTLADLENSGFDPSSISAGVQSLLPNVVRGNDVQRYEQAKRDFLTAVLRRESKANITDKEFAMYDKRYFPKAGDSAEVVEQKRLSREQATENVKSEAGPIGMDKVQKIATAPVNEKKGGGLINEAVAGKMSDEDRQAMEWARANSRDKRAKAILERLGAK